MEIPPRVRGRERPSLGGVVAEGNTPACAGKRAPIPRRGSRRRKYPRVCGEEKTEATVWWSFLEIPPRVRGREPLTKGTLLASGNTPACAGKSFAAQCQGGDYRKYPRVCGEEPSVAGSCKVVMEIPSRVRGRAQLDEHKMPEFGNTPACAGKSRW